MLISKAICDELSDREVIQKSLEQVDYFSCLFDRYEPRLLRYVKRMANVPETEAQDILQEAFINIWKNLHAFDPGLKLSSWIYRIVHNQAISCLRKKKSFGKDQTVNWDESSYAGIADNQSDRFDEPGTDPDLLTREVLDQLPLPYKEVLVLKFLENMSYEEISDVLKIPEGTVATRINRAKKTFRNLSDQQHLSFDL